MTPINKPGSPTPPSTTCTSPGPGPVSEGHAEKDSHAAHAAHSAVPAATTGAGGGGGGVIPRDANFPSSCMAWLTASAWEAWAHCSTIGLSMPSGSMRTTCA